MRRTAWRWLALAGLAAVFMVGITLFSAQEGAVSSGLSRGVLALVEQYLPGVYRLLAATGRPEFALRKLAHFTEYAALGLCLYALARRRLAPLPALALALGMAVAFALWTNGTSSRCPAGTAACGMWASTPSARWPGCSSAGRGRRCAISEDSGLTAPGASPHGAHRPLQKRRRRRCSRI